MKQIKNLAFPYESRIQYKLHLMKWNTHYLTDIVT